jgi:hypothetical protein
MSLLTELTGRPEELVRVRILAVIQSEDFRLKSDLVMAMLQQLLSGSSFIIVYC